MRFILFNRAALVAASLSLVSLAHADPLISAFIGTPTATSKTAYFVMDFNDPGPKPEAYTFKWNYEGAKTAQDFPVALASALTGAKGFQQTGAAANFITSMGFNGRTLFNDFAGNNSGDPNGYWNLWLGFDGANWTNSQFGIATINLSNTPSYTFNSFTQQNELSSASWIGFRWASGTAAAPRVPQAVTAVPETGTLVLAFGGACLLLGGIVARRRFCIAA